MCLAYRRLPLSFHFLLFPPSLADRKAIWKPLGVYTTAGDNTLLAFPNFLAIIFILSFPFFCEVIKKRKKSFRTHPCGWMLRLTFFTSIFLSLLRMLYICFFPNVFLLPFIFITFYCVILYCFFNIHKDLALLFYLSSIPHPCFVTLFYSSLLAFTLFFYLFSVVRYPIFPVL